MLLFFFEDGIGDEAKKENLYWTIGLYLCHSVVSHLSPLVRSDRWAEKYSPFPAADLQLRSRLFGLPHDLWWSSPHLHHTAGKRYLPLTSAQRARRESLFSGNASDGKDGWYTKRESSPVFRGIEQPSHPVKRTPRPA